MTTDDAAERLGVSRRDVLDLVFHTAELIGTWERNEPGHAGRYLALSISEHDLARYVAHAKAAAA